MDYLVVALVVIICLFANRISDKIGLPALVAFMLLGTLFGADVPFRIVFENFALGEKICSAALIFIMFYGGFNLKWKQARSAAPFAITLSTAGVLLTVFFATICLIVLLRMDFKTAFLISSVLGSTDAASVFSILRRFRLNLKDNTASLLEIESGSNDPVAYMLTMIAIQMFLNTSSSNIFIDVILQLGVGIAFGWFGAKLCQKLFDIKNLVSSSMASLAMIGMVLFCYGAASVCKGNAYLSVYLMGILVGNQPLPFKKDLIAFFDGLTTIAQILIFFVLGLLSFPSLMIELLPTSLSIFLILLVIARPLAVFLCSLPFHSNWKRNLLVSFAGLRGAASGVFAAMAVAAGVILPQNLFQIVFMVTLLSVTLQGSLLPWAAKKLDMIDENEDVFKTFNDYVEEASLSLMSVKITKRHPWNALQIKDVGFPKDTLGILVERNNERLACRGDLRLETGDLLVLSVPPYESANTEVMEERVLEAGDPYVGKSLKDLNLDAQTLIALIRRNGQTLVPDGSTILAAGDQLVIYRGTSTA